MRRARVRHFVYMEIIRGCQMETITSRENAKIKYACRLREEEKLRTADGLFFAEGPKLCLELARGCTLQTLYATEKALAHTPELEAFAGKTVLVTEPVAQKLSGTKTSQDVFGVFEHPGWQAADILAKGRRILALEAVQDPGNVGTILRTADCAGMEGLLLSEQCADIFSPKVLRATMGSIFRMPVEVTADLPGRLYALREQGYSVLSSQLDGTPFYQRKGVGERYVLVVGNEGNGVSHQVQQLATHRLRLPMRGGAESLNAAVAAGIMMYELTRELGE
jgi:TrmH family RNA methyltransferase